MGILLSNIFGQNSCGFSREVAFQSFILILRFFRSIFSDIETFISQLH
jgi:hypothetical protein